MYTSFSGRNSVQTLFWANFCSFRFGHAFSRFNSVQLLHINHEGRSLGCLVARKLTTGLRSECRRACDALVRFDPFLGHFSPFLPLSNLHRYPRMCLERCDHTRSMILKELGVRDKAVEHSFATAIKIDLFWAYSTDFCVFSKQSKSTITEM